NKKEKKELTEAEKEYKSKRKMIQQKLIKFATRVPVFMYLTDYREYCLKDVITQLEPELFKKVTGLSVKDFELLVSLNVFNEALMNDAVYKFKRYEDASLTYTGIDKHQGEKVGLYSTVVSREDYDIMAGHLADSMVADAPKADDVHDASFFENAVSNFDEDEEETDVKQVVKPIKREPIAHSNIGSTYRPSFIPPAPVKSEKKEPPQVDVSGVKVGITVKHKAFGEGVVKSIDNNMITVEFNGAKKNFQFPGAFNQGFLKI
ncbi:MAG: restriction endonuclease, partial [Candidatus Ornithomonoglobus sp.]